MAQNKTDYKSIFFQSFLGMIGYFVISAFSKPKLNKSLIFDTANQNVNTEYNATYFKDEEYFKTYPIPAKYMFNWYALQRVLDKIRMGFGSAIVITRGYSPAISGQIDGDYNNCTGVTIKAKNANSVLLKSTIENLMTNKLIFLSEFSTVTNGNFSLIINV